MPVLNRQVVRHGIRLGTALGCDIQQRSQFDRKNYFYPDLPKGYQITQYAEPLCTGGTFVFEDNRGQEQAIAITRIHIEEDACKSLHDSGEHTSLDFNRAGTPLLELVTEPQFHSGKNAALFVAALQQTVRYLGISDGKLEDGSLRCDVNISIEGQQQKVEVKNLNSLRAIEEAIAYEFQRQMDVIASEQPIVSETRLWNEHTKRSESMRTKESTAQYRYIPEPDLLPLTIDDDVIHEEKARLPEMPHARKHRLADQYGIRPSDATILTSEKQLADFFEDTVSQSPEQSAQIFQSATNWICGEILHTLKERSIGIERFPISPKRLAQLLQCIDTGVISGTAAKDVYAEMLDSKESPKEIISRLGLEQLQDADAINAIIQEVVEMHSDAIEQIRNGKDRALGFLVGEVMKQSKGKADPALVSNLLRKAIEGSGI